MESMYFDGKEYELTPKTMKVARQIERAEQSETITEAYKAEFDLVKLAIGDEAAREILGTSNLEDIDLNKMVAVYNAIIDGYDAEIRQLQAEKEAEMFNSPAFKALSNIARDLRTITAAENAKKIVKK